MYYIISGWDNNGNQIVETHKANTQAEAESMFINSIGGGEVNEILDTITDEEYEAEMRKDAGKENDNMTNEENITMNANEIITKANKNHSRKNKRIICVETGETFKSVNEASRTYNTASGSICKVCNGKLKTTKGMTFRYIDENNNIIPVPEMPASTREITIQKPAKVVAKGKRCGGNTKSVFDFTTGDFYTSGTDAAEVIGTTQGNVSRVCNSKGKKANGHKVCYVRDIPEHLDEIGDAIRKANMYDEYMTKKEKYEQLLNIYGEAKCKVKCIEYDIERLYEQLKQAHLEVAKANNDILNFKW